MSFNFNVKAISPVVGKTSFDFDVKSINPTPDIPQPTPTAEIEGVGSSILKVNKSCTIPIVYEGDNGREIKYINLSQPVEIDIATGAVSPNEVDGYSMNSDISRTYSTYELTDELPQVTAPSSKESKNIFQTQLPERYSYIFLEQTATKLQIGETYQVSLTNWTNAGTIRFAIYEYDSSTYTLGARLGYDTSSSSYRVTKTFTFTATTQEIIIYIYYYYSYYEGSSRSFSFSAGCAGYKLITTDKTNQPMALTTRGDNFMDEFKNIQIAARPYTTSSDTGYWGEITINENNVVTELKKSE